MKQWALVPAGRVLLGPLAEQSSSSGGAVDADPKTLRSILASSRALYLDRHPVTNEEFQQFVDAGGYEKLEYWDEEALPALLDFVDQTGRPGPRFWIEGRLCDQRRAAAGRRRELVRGEALTGAGSASGCRPTPNGPRPARGQSNRRPAGSPNVAIPGASRSTFAARTCGARSARSLSTSMNTRDGASVGGIHQLVGNVWEWSSSALACDCRAVRSTCRKPTRAFAAAHSTRTSKTTPRATTKAASIRWRGDTTSASAWRCRCRRWKSPQEVRRQSDGAEQPSDMSHTEQPGRRRRSCRLAEFAVRNRDLPPQSDL